MARFTEIRAEGDCGGYVKRREQIKALFRAACWMERIVGRGRKQLQVLRERRELERAWVKLSEPRAGLTWLLDSLADSVVRQT